ncbi:MAG: MarC family protein [archaeon]
MFLTYFLLVPLFFVIIDPIRSFVYFFLHTNKLNKLERKKIGFLAIIIASLILIIFVILGESFLELIHININVFRIAGGIMVSLLGLNIIGIVNRQASQYKLNDDVSIATVIASPLIAGPAAITTTIISVVDYGKIVTLISILTVIIIVLILFLISIRFSKIFDNSIILFKISSIILGLITFSNGIKFIMIGLHVIT